MSESKKLTKHDITMLGIRSSFLQASFNYERMQACGFLWSMLPVLKKIHGDDKEALSLAMTDNLEFINTHPNLVGFLMGLMMSLEEGGADHDTIKGLKLALFGPIAGIGDAIFWFTILPIVAGISCSFASQGSILGPIIFFLVYLAIWILRIVWTHLGYNLGTKSIDIITENSDTIANVCNIIVLLVVEEKTSQSNRINCSNHCIVNCSVSCWITIIKKKLLVFAKSFLYVFYIFFCRKTNLEGTCTTTTQTIDECFIIVVCF